MTDFVPSFSDQSLIPPWQSTGSRHWCFVIDAEPGCMQSYLDSHFNAPGPDYSPYRYEALPNHDFGILMVTDHTDFSCAGGDREGWDRVAHREVFWQFPAYRHKVEANNLASNSELVWIQPFYFDDNATVMFASREILGSEKQMADITFEEGGQTDELHLDVSIQGFKKFAPRSRSHSIGVLHVKLSPGTEDVAFEKLMKKRGAASFIGTWFGSIPNLSNFDATNPPHPAELKIDTLKQYRDAFDMRKAAYRAIIASKATHSNVKNVRYFKGSDVKLDFAWSDTMKEQFTRVFGLSKPEPEDMTNCKDHLLLGHGSRGRLKSGTKPVADWDLPITSKDVLFALAFQSDTRFEIVDTLHTYGAGIFSP